MGYLDSISLKFIYIYIYISDLKYTDNKIKKHLGLIPKYFYFLRPYRVVVITQHFTHSSTQKALFLLLLSFIFVLSFFLLCLSFLFFSPLWSFPHSVPTFSGMV